MFPWVFENLEFVKTKFKRIHNRNSFSFFKFLQNWKKNIFTLCWLYFFNLFQEHLEPIWYQSTIFWNNSWLFKATLDSHGTSLLFLEPEVTFTIPWVKKTEFPGYICTFLLLWHVKMSLTWSGVIFSSLTNKRTRCFDMIIRFHASPLLFIAYVNFEDKIMHKQSFVGESIQNWIFSMQILTTLTPE